MDPDNRPRLVISEPVVDTMCSGCGHTRRRVENVSYYRDVTCPGCDAVLARDDNIELVTFPANLLSWVIDGGAALVAMRFAVVGERIPTDDDPNPRSEEFGLVDFVDDNCDDNDICVYARALAALAVGETHDLPHWEYQKTFMRTR